MEDLHYMEQEGCVRFQNGNILHVEKNLDGYIDFTGYTGKLEEIDGGQYDCDVSAVTTVGEMVEEVLDFMEWKHWGSYEKISSDVLDEVA